MLYDNDSDVLEAVLLEEDIDTGKKAQLIVYNDDYNTFDWVIECFMDVLKHTSEQSEQLAMIVHYKGKCTVKTGEYEELKPQCSKLLQAGLSAEIT